MLSSLLTLDSYPRPSLGTPRIPREREGPSTVPPSLCEAFRSSSFNVWLLNSLLQSLDLILEFHLLRGIPIDSGFSSSKVESVLTTFATVDRVVILGTSQSTKNRNLNRGKCQSAKNRNLIWLISNLNRLNWSSECNSVYCFSTVFNRPILDSKLKADHQHCSFPLFTTPTTHPALNLCVINCPFSDFLLTTVGTSSTDIPVSHLYLPSASRTSHSFLSLSSVCSSVSKTTGSGRYPDSGFQRISLRLLGARISAS